MFNSYKKKNTQKLIDSFGKHKDESFDFEQIDKYFEKKDNSKSSQVLSEKTCNDLDINELFNTKIKAIHYSDFLNRIKDKKYKLLVY